MRRTGSTTWTWIWLAGLLAGPALPPAAWGWGIHDKLTRAAVGLLPPADRAVIAKFEGEFVRRYCVYPDAFRDADAAPYVLKFPDEAKVSHHIPGSLAQHRLLFQAYVPRVVALFKQGQTEEAMRFFGSLAHYLEDSSAPCHMRYGEVAIPEKGPPLLTMEYFKQFLPASELLEHQQLHARIDGCPMTQEQLDAAVAGYRPRLLGHSVEELIFNLYEEHLRVNAAGSRQIFPMLTALAAGDEGRFVACGVEAAAAGTKLVADVLHSVLALAAGRPLGQPAAEVDLCDRTPAVATAFAWTDRNHQGRLIRNASGTVWDNMSEPAKLGRQPLRLKMDDGATKEFAKGFGVGWRSEFTFLIPRGTFTSFVVWAGNDAALGQQTANYYDILLDGKEAAGSGLLKGAAAAKRLEVPLGEATELTLRCRSEGKPSASHGVWAVPTLVR